MMHMFGDYGMGMGIFGMVFMFLFWGLAIAGLVYLIRTMTGSGHKDASEETAEDILKQRYAKGEISAEEYGRMKKDIMG